MDLVSSKPFAYPLIFESIIHNGLTFSSSNLSQIKYLKFFLHKEILLDVIILSTFISFVLIGYLE